MKLSTLQKYILKQGILVRNQIISKSTLEKFYDNLKKKPKDITKVINRSIGRLIKKELVIGYGWRTPHKWFIRQMKLTPKGKKIAKGLLGKQQRLPLRIRKGKKPRVKN